MQARKVDKEMMVVFSLSGITKMPCKESVHI